MLRVFAQQYLSILHLKVLKLEARHDCAGAKSVCSCRFRCLLEVRSNNENAILRSNFCLLMKAIVRQSVDLKRIAFTELPYLFLS